MELADVLDWSVFVIILLGIFGVGFVTGYDEGYEDGYADGWDTLLVGYNMLEEDYERLAEDYYSLVEDYEGLAEDYNSLVEKYNRICWAVPVQDLIDQLGYSTEDMSWTDMARFVSLVV